MVNLRDIYPREYQSRIAERCIMDNTLVVLPTGLGKTVIALIAVASRLGKFESSKAMVLAPTKPLAMQHMKTFMKHMELDEGSFSLLTGEMEPSKRAEMWKRSKVVFATPQTVYNDAVSGRISLRDVVVAVFDEAHRTVRDYTYTKLAEMYMAEASNPRIIGLTASPGGDLSRINEITRNLFIRSVETRTEQDEDVRSYVESIKIEPIRLKIPEEYGRAVSILKEMLKRKVSKLEELGLLQGSSVSKKMLLELRSHILKMLENEKEREKRGYLFTALILQIQAVSILHALELLQTQGSFTLWKYIQRLGERNQSRSIRLLTQENEWKILRDEVETIKDIEHSKYFALKSNIEKQLEHKPDSRILVFAQYRDTIEHLVGKLASEGFSVQKFVGQADKEGSEGMNQDKQQAVLEYFSSGKCSILVSSSVGEEGLHIPDVDLVIFYDAVPSEIRAIQRRGRTGRSREGKVILLLAEGTMDLSYYYSSIAKERRMRRIITNRRTKLREPTLFDFSEN